jgi:hypothetical protein
MAVLRAAQRAVCLCNGEELIALKNADSCGFVGRPRELLELGHRDRTQVERSLGPLGEPDDDEAEAIFARLIVLLDESPPLERREQPRRR